MIGAFLERFQAHSPFRSAHQSVKHSLATCLSVGGSLFACLVPRVVFALRAPISEPMSYQILVIDAECPRHALNAPRRGRFVAGYVWETGRDVGPVAN